MAMQVKYTVVIFGDETTRYDFGVGGVEDIQLNPEAKCLIVFMEDGSIMHYFDCSMLVVSADNPDVIIPEKIIAPKIEIAS